MFAHKSSEEKEDVNQSVESTPQMTPIATNTTAPIQSPSSEQQPEIDEDGYCIQPKDPLWNTQWPKKGKCPIFITTYEYPPTILILWFFSLQPIPIRIVIRTTMNENARYM